MSAEVGSSGRGLRVPFHLQLAVCVGAGLASVPVFFWLHAQGLVTGPPVVLALLVPVLGLLGTRPLQHWIGRGSLETRPGLRLTLAFVAFAAFCWTAGWSLVLPAAAILVAVVHIQRSGAGTWRRAVLAVTVTTVAGQVGVATGLVASVAPVEVSHMAAGSILLLTCLGIVNVGFTVLERDAVSTALARTEARLRALMESSTDVLTVSASDGALTYVSPAVHRSLGYEPSSLLGTQLLDLVDPEQRPIVSGRLGDVVEAGLGARTSLDVLVVLEGTERRWYEWTVHNLLDDPLVEGLVVEQRDVTDRLLHQDALAHAASHDELTGLPNRGDLMRRLAACLTEVGPGAGLAVLFLDLDRFKQVNDTHGHAAGDELLVVLARRLRSALRPHDHLARISGDEFCAILTEVRDQAEVDAVIVRLERVVAQPVALDENALVNVGVSIGVALAFETSRDPAALFSAADAAMYGVKRERRSVSDLPDARHAHSTLAEDDEDDDAASVATG
ncbi:MAG: diguanylate cyclase [Cellulomonadaceae bacterium]|nr:diguanylate cyclase [Cellulomonadaceae bacterium]